MVLGKTGILITLGCDVLYIKGKQICMYGMSEDRVDSNVVVAIVKHLYNSLSKLFEYCGTKEHSPKLVTKTLV